MAAAPLKGSLALSKVDGEPSKNKLAWKWHKGALTTLADFGDPTTATSYRLCIYDGADARVATAAIPGGTLCGDSGCWKSSAKGFTYKDKLGLVDGVRGLALSMGKGTDGTAKIDLKVAGAGFAMPSLPLVGPVRALLLNSTTSTSWCATYTSPASTDLLNTTKWKDKND